MGRDYADTCTLYGRPRQGSLPRRDPSSSGERMKLCRVVCQPPSLLAGAPRTSARARGIQTTETDESQLRKLETSWWQAASLPGWEKPSLVPCPFRAVALGRAEAPRLGEARPQSPPSPTRSSPRTTASTVPPSLRARAHRAGPPQRLRFPSSSSARIRCPAQVVGSGTGHWDFGMSWGSQFSPKQPLSRPLRYFVNRPTNKEAMATGTEAARGLSDTGLLLPGALAPAQGLAGQACRPALSPGRPVPGRSGHLPGPLLSGRGTGSPSGRDAFWNGLGFLALLVPPWAPRFTGWQGPPPPSRVRAPCFWPRGQVSAADGAAGWAAVWARGRGPHWCPHSPPHPERAAGAKGRATPRRVSYGPAGRRQGSDGLCVTGLPLGCSRY